MITLEEYENLNPRCEIMHKGVFVDVGANVGVYTTWAAKTRGVRVFSFEPQAQNHSPLNRNIVLNGLDGRVTAYCLALSDEAGLSELDLSALRLGASCHSLGEREGFRHEPMKPAYSQGCVAARLYDIKVHNPPEFTQQGQGAQQQPAQSTANFTF